MARRDADPLVIGRVVGDVLDPFVRTTNLRVRYNTRTVSNGCELKPSMVAHQPRVEVGGLDMRTFYTLVRASRRPSPCFHSDDLFLLLHPTGSDCTVVSSSCHYYRIDLCSGPFVPATFGPRTIGGFCLGSNG